MKKIIAATLFASVFASAAHAAPTDVTIGAAGAFTAVGNVTTDINLARQFNLVAQPSRAGFVKNSFEATLSANVVGALIDEPANNRMGVAAGSNKGYVVFTGSSVGGSVSQCGDPIAKTVTNLAASEVKAGVIVLANANGCGRAAGGV